MLNFICMKKEHDLEFLEKLLTTAMPSGYETIDGSYLIRNYLGKLGLKEIMNTTLGTFAFKQGNGPKKILISAHYDEIGFQVQNFTEAGLLNIVPIGGLDTKVLPGQVVEIYTRSGKIVTGVIGKKPIHAESYEERKGGCDMKIEELLVDIGAIDKAEAKKMVFIGDYGVIKSQPILNLGNKETANRLMGRALDDKIGMYVVCEVAKYLSEKNFDKYYTLIYAGFPQEETGLRGARQVRELNPDVSIDIDVTYATDEGRGISSAEQGSVELGKGVVINHGPDKNYDLNYSLIKTADKEGIPYQEIVTDCGGTNTHFLQLMAKDCQTTHLSIGLRNLHTPVEICDWDDVESTIDLICKTIENLEV